jgi:NAD(P)-dependent dehydrogenase (short-subunit alcohol dehydrogenase family)
LDVTQPEQVRTAVAAAIEAFGKIDVVLNNAGHGVYGALELATEATIDQQFAVNVRGVINVIRGFLPHFRTNKAGMFINISSFMGITTAVPLGSLYNMSKFALEGLTEGLYYELKPHNIQLRLVEPGGFASEFGNNMTFHKSDTIKDYDDVTTRVSNIFKGSKERAASLTKPTEIADVIYQLATGASQQFRTLVGPDAAMVMGMRNSMPIEAYMEKVDSLFG